MQAIITKYHGPTDRKGSRVSATNPDGKRVILSWDNSFNADRNHMQAVATLCQRMNWHGEVIGGGLKGACMAWVFVDDRYRFTA